MGKCVGFCYGLQLFLGEVTERPSTACEQYLVNSIARLQALEDGRVFRIHRQNGHLILVGKSCDEVARHNQSFFIG